MVDNFLKASELWVIGDDQWDSVVFTFLFIFQKIVAVDITGAFYLFIDDTGFIVELLKNLLQFTKFVVSIFLVGAYSIVTEGLAVHDGAKGMWWVGAGWM